MAELKSFLLVFLLLAAGLAGCSKGAKPPEAKRPQHQDIQYAGKLAVRILPEVPTAAEDLQVIFTGSGSAAYRWEKNGVVIAGEQGARLAKKWYARGDMITAVVTAKGEEGRASLTIENALPEVTSVAVSPENICRGVDITATPAGADADGDPIGYSFKWIVNGEELSEDTPVLKGDRFKCGDRVSLKVTPHDDYGTGRAFATQAFVIPEALPRFVSSPPTSFSGNTYVYDAKAEAPDGDAISYALVSAPPGMTINRSSGRIEWQVSRESREYTIEIEAKNSKGLCGYQRYSLAITIH